MSIEQAPRHRGVTIHPRAEVSADARIGPGTRIWSQAQIREGAVVGAECILGKGSYLDFEVSIGDRFRVGSAELVVTQPRLPCFKLGIKMGRDEFVTEFLERGLLGFYLAVVQEGDVAAGDAIVELERDPRAFRVTEVARLYAYDRHDVEGMRRAAAVNALPQTWRDYFCKRVDALAV